METIEQPLLDYGVASFILPGQTACGDYHVACCNTSGVLIAAIDGVGHGEEAARAAEAAGALLKANRDEPIISLAERCHEELKSTRGVVLSLASVDMKHGLMTWLGVGSVQGILTRASARKGAAREVLLLRGGVVGSQLPPLQAAVLPVFREDTVVFVTDGVRPEFAEGLSPLESPRRAADRILERYRSGKDDALVLVARLTGIDP